MKVAYMCRLGGGRYASIRRFRSDCGARDTGNMLRPPANDRRGFSCSTGGAKPEADQKPFGHSESHEVVRMRWVNLNKSVRSSCKVRLLVCWICGVANIKLTNKSFLISGAIGEGVYDELYPFIHYRSSFDNVTILVSRPKWLKSGPIFRPKRRKNHRGAAHIYTTYIRKNHSSTPPPPRIKIKVCSSLMGKWAIYSVPSFSFQCLVWWLWRLYSWNTVSLQWMRGFWSVCWMPLNWQLPGKVNRKISVSRSCAFFVF